MRSASWLLPLLAAAALLGAPASVTASSDRVADCVATISDLFAAFDSISQAIGHLSSDLNASEYLLVVANASNADWLQGFVDDNDVLTSASDLLSASELEVPAVAGLNWTEAVEDISEAVSSVLVGSTNSSTALSSWLAADGASLAAAACTAGLELADELAALDAEGITSDDLATATADDALQAASEGDDDDNEDATSESAAAPLQDDGGLYQVVARRLLRSGYRTLLQGSNTTQTLINQAARDPTAVAAAMAIVTQAAKDDGWSTAAGASLAGCTPGVNCDGVKSLVRVQWKMPLPIQQTPAGPKQLQYMQVGLHVGDSLRLEWGAPNYPPAQFYLSVSQVNKVAYDTCGAGAGSVSSEQVTPRPTGNFQVTYSNPGVYWYADLTPGPSNGGKTAMNHCSAGWLFGVSGGLKLQVTVCPNNQGLLWSDNTKTYTCLKG